MLGIDSTLAVAHSQCSFLLFYCPPQAKTRQSNGTIPFQQNAIRLGAELLTDSQPPTRTQRHKEVQQCICAEPHESPFVQHARSVSQQNNPLCSVRMRPYLPGLDIRLKKKRKKK